MIAAILGKLQGVIDRGSGRYYAVCPAHDDRSPSLSVNTGDDGRILLYCFAGCSAESILQALGLTWSDLYPDRWEASRQAAHHGAGRLPKVDPLEVDRWILKIAVGRLRSGKALNLEDEARVQVARQRLAAAGRQAA